MFMARPHRRALAFLGFWVRQAPHGTPRIGAVVGQPARRNRVAPRGDWCGTCGRLPENSECKRILSASGQPQPLGMLPLDPSQEPIDQTLNEWDGRMTARTLCE